MTVFPVRIGVDEIATETQKCDGFTFFCLPEAHVSSFTKETKKVLKSAGLEVFHGKDFQPKHAEPYKKFLSLAFTYLKKSPQSFAACRLFSARFKSELAGFCDRFVEKAVGKSLGAGHSAVPILQPYFLPLASLAALSRELAPSVQMHVEMDSHESLKDLDQVVHETLGVQVDAATLLKGMYNGYAKGLNERTPLLPDGGVSVLDDEASVMVQAADVIGNFAMAHIFVRLGKDTTRRKAKSDVLYDYDVLGSEELDALKPRGRLTFSGNDLVLSKEGAITFKVAGVIIEPPTDPSPMKHWPIDDRFLGKGET